MTLREYLYCGLGISLAITLVTFLRDKERGLQMMREQLWSCLFIPFVGLATAVLAILGVRAFKELGFSQTTTVTILTIVTFPPLIYLYYRIDRLILRKSRRS